MRLVQLFFAGAVLLCVPLVASGVTRTATTDVPTIAGRDMPRLVLVQHIKINRLAPGLSNRDMMDRLMGQMLAGQLVPVSEDRTGVYYQSTRGFQREGSTSSVPAGLYVNKTRANTIFAYTGEARELSEQLLLDVQPLSGADMAKLKIGAPAAKTAK